ncbi:MAG TPA: hypothetical protein VJR04_06440, partial [Terriglobales bacterium]|nr:hypothetical protein [Terriglobales bacterium]
MKRELFAVLIISSLFSNAAFAQAKPQNKVAAKAQSALVDRVGDTGFVQVKAESFRTLNAKQQELAYWLYEAAVAIDPIIYDQLSAYALREKRLLEEVIAHEHGIDPQVMEKITAYAKLFWANRGNHNDLTAQKFVPDFSFDDLKNAAQTAQKNGAF